MLLQSKSKCPYSLLVCSAYKSSAADSLLAERGRIDSSHQMTDTIIQYVAAAAHYSIVACADSSAFIPSDKHTKPAQNLAGKGRTSQA